MSGTGPGATWTPPGTGKTNGATAPPIHGDVWQWVDPRLLPPRPWLLGTVLLRGYTTLLGSPGGTGKTAWAVAAGLAVITGRKDILGLHSFVQGAVWFITLEDDRVELQRRIAAAMMEHGISAGDVGTSLFLSDGRLKLVERDPQTNLAVVTPSVEDCKDFIRDNNIILCVIDPLVKAHSVNGSLNEDMDVLITASNEIGHDTNCAMLVPCHFRKGGDIDTDGRDLFRGASSLIDGSRIAAGMQAMTKQEGATFGIKEDDVGRFVRMVNAKANMSPKATATDWYELVGRKLGNDRVDPAYPAGDEVQTVKRWNPPKLMDDMDLPVMQAIFARLGDPQQIFHATAGNGRNWAGTVVMAQAGKSKDQASRILKLWIDSGTLVAVTYKNNSREDRIKLVPDAGKVAAILSSMAATHSGP